MVALQGGHHVRHRTLSVPAGPAVAVDGEPRAPGRERAMRGHVGQAPGGCSVSVPARRLNHEARFTGFQGEYIHAPDLAESSQTGSIAPRPLLGSQGYEDALVIVGLDLSCAVGFLSFRAHSQTPVEARMRHMGAGGLGVRMDCRSCLEALNSFNGKPQAIRGLPFWTDPLD